MPAALMWISGFFAAIAIALFAFAFVHHFYGFVCHL